MRTVSQAEAVTSTTPSNGRRRKPWCNGKIGLLGISYYAINQWFVANLQPPSLKAIVPWEGFADLYRDALYHGGILNVFMTNWFTAHLMHHKLGARRGRSLTVQTNQLNFWLSHNLDTGRVHRCAGRLGQDHGAVLFGRQLDRLRPASARNTEAFMRSKSKHKKLACRPAAMCIRSTPRKAARISFAFSTIGSRAPTTA